MTKNPTIYLLQADVCSPESVGKALREIPNAMISHAIGWHSPEVMWTLETLPEMAKTWSLALWKPEDGETPITTRHNLSLQSSRMRLHYHTFAASSEIDGMIAWARDWRKTNSLFRRPIPKDEPLVAEFGGEASNYAIAIGLALAQGKALAIGTCLPTNLTLAMCHKFGVSIDATPDGVREAFT